MFSGIVEAVSEIVDQTQLHQGLARIRVERPQAFDDLKQGDSIAVNGICLTLEQLDDRSLAFALGAETLRVLSVDGNERFLLGKKVNLERSLKLGDRIHGHLVSGHVDEQQRILEKTELPEVTLFKISHSPENRPHVFRKGSITINGVSLTINEVENEGIRNSQFQKGPGSFSVCLIPETLKRTNLGSLKKGDHVLLEFDWLSKNFAHQIRAYLSDL